MKQSRNILISALKRQPRQGMPDPNYISNLEAMRLALEAEMKQLVKSGKNIVDEVMQNFGDITSALTDSNLALQTGVGKLIKVFDDVSTKMLETVKSATFLEQRNKSLNKTLGISSKVSAELGDTYDEMAKTLGVGGERIREISGNLNKMLPGMSKIIASNEKFRNQLFMTNEILTKQTGLTEEQANNYQLFAAGIGKSSLDMIAATSAFTDDLEARTGLVGQFKEISSEIADLGADIQMQYGKIPGALETAVIKAKMLGMKFADIEKIATKMLDIEASVNDELNYQLISGQRLVDVNGESITEKMRIAKLTGDTAKMEEAMADVYETQRDILEGNNFYAKQQLAQTMGITEAEMMKAYQTQKLIKSMPGMNASNIDKIMSYSPDQFEQYVKENNTTAAQKEILDKMRKESQLTTDEKYSQLMDQQRTDAIIKAIGGKAGGVISGATSKILGADQLGGEGTVVGATAKLGKFGVSGPMASILGNTQLMGAAAETVTEQFSGLGKIIPLLGSAIESTTSKINSIVTTVLGQQGTTANTTATTKANDAIIQFNPADKMMMLASTSTGQLGQAAETLAGGSIDAKPIADAIIAAMANMKVEVNYNPMEASKAIEFGVRTING